MESHWKIQWNLVNYSDRGRIKNDSTTAIDRGFHYFGIKYEPKLWIWNAQIESTIPNILLFTIARPDLTLFIRHHSLLLLLKVKW